VAIFYYKDKNDHKIPITK